MRGSLIERKFGRKAFGNDPANYHAARPGYPDWVFDVLQIRCGLGPGSATFEIGPGTGSATRRLLRLGADPLIAIEPDVRLASYLRETIHDRALSIIASAFEEAELPRRHFDLGVCATAFHWMEEDGALAKVADVLRAGGWWAMFWNVFGDADRPDPFHEATKDLLKGPASPSEGSGDTPFALDSAARMAALERTGVFENIEYRGSRWSLLLDPDQTIALYATFSNIAIRPDREAVLAELHRIAREDFGGRVTRNMTTSLYSARRRS